MRYAELRPDELASAVRECPVAIWPIGALEWHGPHLPLGLDGIVAEAFGKALRVETGGVLLPTLWHPITTLPHPLSFDIPTSTFRQIVSSTAGGLAGAGFKVLCIVTGHYAQGHSLVLFDLADELASKIAILTASPLEPLEDEALLDHAGKWETAQLAAIRHDLVDLDALPREVHPKVHAVLGDHPRHGSVEEALSRNHEALAIWRQWVAEALHGDLEAFCAFYARRREVYADYRRSFYRESWEQAIRDWWETQA